MKPRTYHRGDKVNAKGGVSALCYSKPRSINLKQALWTLSDAHVTCSKCKAIIAARSPIPAQEAGRVVTGGAK
jgi:hypothetical protein